MTAGPLTLVLRSGQATAEVAPSVGGRLMRWTIGDRPVLHWPPAADWAAPAKIRGGNPLLFPLIARTFLDGKIGFWRDPCGEVRPAPMHGLVRAATFQVTHRTDDRVVMSVAWDEHMAEAWPFPFVFTVEYALVGNLLAVAFTVENTGEEKMPYSVGNHFYFAVPAAARQDWELSGAFRSCARQNAEGRIEEVPGLRDPIPLSDPRLVDLFHVGPPPGGLALRHRGDGREVLFDWPASTSGDNPWYAVTTWAESPRSDFYCVEPWTALPDAVHNGRGLRWLTPGARETLRLGLTARGW